MVSIETYHHPLISPVEAHTMKFFMLQKSYYYYIKTHEMYVAQTTRNVIGQTQYIIHTIIMEIYHGSYYPHNHSRYKLLLTRKLNAQNLLLLSDGKMLEKLEEQLQESIYTNIVVRKLNDVYWALNWRKIYSTWNSTFPKCTADIGRQNESKLLLNSRGYVWIGILQLPACVNLRSLKKDKLTENVT